jgi:hypothetical protein
MKMWHGMILRLFVHAKVLKYVIAIRFTVGQIKTSIASCVADLEGGNNLKIVRLTVTLAAIVVSCASLAAAQQTTPPWLPGVVPRFTVIRRPGLNVDNAMSQSLAGATIPLWNGALPSPAEAYPFVMVGTDPAQGSVTTTVPTVIVPLIFQFHNGGTHGLNPTLDTCSGPHSALNLVRNSPIFQSVPFTAGPTSLGTTQFLDAFQRGNFWNDVSTTSPNYHILLSKTGQTAAVVVSVPTSEGSWMPLNGNKCPRVGLVDIDWFDGTIVSRLLSRMAALKPTVFTIFLTYNVFLTESGQCCDLGYHSQIYGTKGMQTYAVAAYPDPNLFDEASIQDINPLSHEVAEWLDDPLTETDVNITPAWGDVGEFGGVGDCSDYLEVGDPLTGTDFAVPNPKTHFTYHPQDLTFHYWYAQGGSSSSVNGWYDWQDNFGSSAEACPPGGP